MEAQVEGTPGRDTIAPDVADFGRKLSPSAPKSRCLKHLHARLSEVKGDAPLAERLTAIEKLARWVCDGPKPPVEEGGAVEPAPTTRLRLLVKALDEAPAFRTELATCVRTVLAESSALHLLAEGGLPNPRGMWVETTDRIAERLLPTPSDPKDLGELLARMFRSEKDAAWLADVSGQLCADIASRLDDCFGPVRTSVEDAVSILCTRVSALALHGDIRKRGPEGPVRESPFFRLASATHEQLPEVAASCRSTIRIVHERMEQHGVSVDVVYRLDLIELALERAETFVALLRSPTKEDAAGLAAKLMAALTAARLEERSLRDLIGDNTRLLARKIIERAGETGEHYITSTRREWWGMIASAGGGGFLTCGTCALKFLTKWGHLPLFIDGVLSSVNYAASFVLMQLLGFTLATKQPSMTAPAIAGAIRGSKGKHEMDELVTMIARTCRSQLAAVCGNLGVVIPTAILFQMLYVHWTGHSFLDEESAHTTIDSFHPFKSGTIFYAAFTGVLLWASSLGAGYLENWSVYRRLPEGIATHRWGRFLGRGTMRFFGRFLAKQVSGFGGNVTLGILLGMVPALAKFTGLPIDVRHVTLSTGALTLSVCALGPELLTTEPVLAAAGGIACMAILNFGVSFVLALGVAFNARQVHVREAFRLLFQVIRRMFSTPLEFVYPPKVEAVPVRAALHTH